MKKNDKATTLIDLIVFFTLFAVVWIIAFLTYTSYLVSARDSKRLVELENISWSLWKYILNSWFYPVPDNSVEISYSWKTVWTQWVFWNNLSNIIWYSDDVLDPLTKNEYTYSVKNTKKEYSLAWVMEERPWMVSYNWIINKAYADLDWKKEWSAIINWNYNWEILSIQLSWKSYVLALPSIISSDINNTELVDIIDNNKLVYNDYNNLPHSYRWTKFKVDNNLDFSANKLVVFSWSISDLKQTYNQVTLLQNLYEAYSWSILWEKISVNKLDKNELYSSDPWTQIKIMACDIVNFKLKYFVECWWLDFLTFFIINVLHIDISNLPWTKVSNIYQDDSWNFVFWTNQWLAFYDWSNWLVYDQNDSWLVHNYITSITQDNNWDYWIWTHNGISKLIIWNYLDKSDDIWVTIWKDLLVWTNIQYIYTDDYWVVWIWTNKWATSYDWDIWLDYTRKTTWLSHNNITAIYSDSQGNVWFWTNPNWNAKWVDKYNIETWDVTNYSTWKLPDNRVTYIFEDSTSKIWVWTKWWVWFTPDFWDNWSTFTNSNTSWWLIDNYITYMFEDSYWNIWFWTYNWLSRYDWSTWVIYNIWSWLLWNYIFLVSENEDNNIVVFSDWWLDTIDRFWNIITWP
jgi:hypothetical protein